MWCSFPCPDSTAVERTRIHGEGTMINPLMIAGLATLTVAVAIYLLTVYLPIGRSAVSKRLEKTLSTPDPAEAKAIEHEFDSREFRAALALRKLRLSARPGEEVRALN